MDNDIKLNDEKHNQNGGKMNSMDCIWPFYMDKVVEEMKNLVQNKDIIEAIQKISVGELIDLTELIDTLDKNTTEIINAIFGTTRPYYPFNGNECSINKYDTYTSSPDTCPSHICEYLTCPALTCTILSCIQVAVPAASCTDFYHNP